MAIKIIIRRKFKEGHLRQAAEMLIQARRNAMQETGYISSETLSNYDDPNEIIVLSMWQTMEDWSRYKESPPRKELEGMFAGMLKDPTHTIVYNMGMRT